MRSDPTPSRNIGNGDSVTDQDTVGVLLKRLVHGAVQAARLVSIAVNAILDWLGSVAYISIDKLVK